MPTSHRSHTRIEMKPAKKVMSHWNTCPADILHLIFQLLSPAEHQALCLVNRSYQSIAAPLLYSRIHFTWLVKNFEDHSESEPPPPVTRLLRTLLSKPQLAAHIRSFHLKGRIWCVGEARFKFPKIHIPEDELDESIASIDRTGVPYREHWSQELRGGSVDALVALILTQLPSVRHIHLGGDFTRQCALTCMMLRSAICEAGTYQLCDFQHLQTLSYLRRETRDEAYGKSIEIRNHADILPFFYLPNIRHVRASMDNMENWTWPTPHAPVASKLTSLDLYTIREGCLGEILSVTKNLTALSWKWYYDTDVRDQFVTQILDLDKIGTALSHVQETLTDLTITADSLHQNIPFGHGITEVGSLRAMVNCARIKTLQIPLIFLVGFAQDKTKRLQDVLPKSIEFLTITDDLAYQSNEDLEKGWHSWEWEDYTIPDLVGPWIRERTRWAPTLKRVTLLLEWMNMETDQWLSRVREQLQALSVQTGIPIELTGEAG
ncbi:hypothetical protein BDW42DRAFT_175402 [Aspergillus taichungensis]|uniref:Leucine-rich repeat domain-containing protein n=1 Tax=Aspergillus taichungensis TaxID=482145 RepID=A0A2J5HLZ1_9EURO|nr:hypothetical protein BDW42DRAFT_175402 [Aspergillus taichungensis]